MTTCRLLIIAPFARGREFGGSMRATALAERLEARGIETGWVEVPPRRAGVLAKATSLAQLRPGLVQYHTGARVSLPCGWNAALAVHSYLWPYLAGQPDGALLGVDFQNLEWRHLESLRQLGSGPPGHLAVQARLMRRFEIDVVRSADLSVFVSQTELEWAEAKSPAGASLLVPNVLPRASAAAAERICDDRRRSSPQRSVVYLGHLTHVPNVRSLARFLRRSWPAILREWPELELWVVGEAASSVGHMLGRARNVTVLGFVDDVAPLLAKAAAAVLPIDTTGGSSMRGLYFALAGVPIIGTAGAFRGLPSTLGRTAETTEDWVSALDAALHARLSTDDARQAALRVQDDAAPWDALAAIVTRGGAR